MRWIFALCAALLAGTLVALAGSASSGQNTSASGKDPRLNPITQRQLLDGIAGTPLTSSLHEVLISRANHSHLIETAYRQYRAIQRSHPKDPYADLWCGEAAMLYWEDFALGSVAKISYARQNDLFQLTRACLGGAAKHLPQSAVALREYGFFRWQFDNHMAEGLTLMRKAVQIDPKDPVAHVRLGYVYMNPSGNAYDLAKAREELETALRLEPSYAVPHNWLAEVYRQQHKESEAQRERAAYLAKVPLGSDITGVATQH